MSIPAPIRHLGRGFRRAILPLVGYWDLRKLLEQTHARQRYTDDLVLQVTERLGETMSNLVLQATERVIAQTDDLVLQATERIIRQTDDLMLQATERLAKHWDAHQGLLLSRLRDTELRLDRYLTFHVGELSREIAFHVGELSSEIAAVVERYDPARKMNSGRRLEESGDPLSGIRDTGERLFWTQLKLDAVFVCDNFDLVVPAEELGLIAYFLRHGVGQTERGVRTLLLNRLHPGDTAVSIGTNVGIHAISMAQRVGSSGALVCVEPVPHLVCALERSLSINRVAAQTRIVRAAAADRDGETTFFQATHSPLSSFFPVEVPAEVVRVKTVMLDSLFQSGSRVDLIQIDAEGAEPLIYEGMKRIISENHELDLILEWSASHFERSGHLPYEFMQRLRADGFQPFMIGDDGTPLPYSGFDSIDGANLLFTHSVS
jgi:FkbM family methyltransferase